MTGLDDRKKGQEGMYVHEEEVAFKTTIKRNNMFVEWVADQIGVAEGDREEFKKPYGILDLSDTSAGALIQRAHDDMEAAGIDLSEHRLENVIKEMRAKAEEIVRGG